MFFFFFFFFFFDSCFICQHALYTFEMEVDAKIVSCNIFSKQQDKGSAVTGR